MNQIDALGRKQGFWRKTDSLGAKVYEGTFKDDRPQGTFTYYYVDGKVKTISRFSEDGRKTRSVSYFKNGRMMARGNYINMKKDSIWLFYSENDTCLVSREPYSDGQLQGIATTYYPDGKIAEQIEYRNGIKDGLWEQFFTTGKLKLKGAYSNGENIGPFIVYFPGGQIMMTGTYAEGHQDGEWRYYEESGKMVRQETYQLGKLVKEVTR
jgi:antitoxin component YwqK of YwqJK toxin-antitoxin module